MTTLEHISSSRPFDLFMRGLRGELPDVSPARRRFSPAITAIASATIVLATYRLLFGTWENFFGTIDQYKEPFCDFRRFFYEMGRVFFTEKSPVHGYFYSPFFAIVLGFFGALNFDTSLAIWIGLQAVAGLLLFYLSYTIAFGKRWEFLGAGIPLFFLGFPLLHNFKWGQVGVFVVLLALAGFYAWRKGHPVIAMLLIALSASIKYYTGILFLYFLFRKEYKYFLLGLGMLTVLFILVPAFVLGASGSVAFYQVLGTRVARQMVRLDTVNSQYIVNVLMRYGFGNSSSLQLYASLFTLAGYGVLLGNLYLLARVTASGVEESEYWAFVILSLSTPFFVATSWPHYLVYLPFCQFFLLRKLLEANDRNSRAWKCALSIGPSVVLSSVVLFSLSGDHISYNTPGFLFWSNAALLIPVYAELVPLIKHAPARARRMAFDIQ